MNMNLKALISAFAFLLAGSLLAVDLQEDIKLHLECAAQCDRCIENGPGADYVKACQDCAATCRYTAIMMANQSALCEQAHGICDLACQTCAKQCSSSEDPDCKRCVEACNACLAACPKHQAAERAAQAAAKQN